MKIKVTTVYVNDQERALRFYTDVLGFTAKADFSNGGYRWLTVVSPEEPDGVELQLELNSDPDVKTFQQAQFQKSHPAAMFQVADAQAEYDRMVAKGATFTMPPTRVTGSTIAVVDDTCGNLIQLSAVDAWNE